MLSSLLTSYANVYRNGSVILSVSVKYVKDKFSLQRYVVQCLTESNSMEIAGLDMDFLKDQFPK